MLPRYRFRGKSPSRRQRPWVPESQRPSGKSESIATQIPPQPRKKIRSRWTTTSYPLLQDDWLPSVTIRISLIKRNHNLGISCRILAPGAENRRGLFERHGSADGFRRGKSLLLEHADDLSKILGQRVAGSENVEFFLYEQASFVADEILGVSDVNNAAGERDLLDGHAKCVGSADGLDNNVRADI